LPENFKKMIGILDNLGYVPKIPVNISEVLYPEKRDLWQKEKDMKAFMLYSQDNLLNKVDILIFNPINFQEAYNRRQIVIAQEKDEISVA
jgi:hypothetical protein